LPIRSAAAWSRVFPQPGGNVTGFTIMEPTLPGKWLELLKEIAPRVNRAAFLFNPAVAPYAAIRRHGIDHGQRDAIADQPVGGEFGLWSLLHRALDQMSASRKRGAGNLGAPVQRERPCPMRTVL